MSKLRAIDFIDDPGRRLEALRERVKADKCIYCGQKKGIQSEEYTCPFNRWPPDCAERIRITRQARTTARNQTKTPSYIHDVCSVFGLAALVVLVALLTHVVGILVAW